MRLPIFSSLLLVISLFSLFQTPTFAKIETYIVLLGSHPHHSNASFVDYDHAVKYHQELLASCLGSIKKARSSIFYSYHRFVNGFAADLDDKDVPKVRRKKLNLHTFLPLFVFSLHHPNVVSVFQALGKKIRTTNSWNFLGLEEGLGNNIPLNSAWRKAKFGEDIIIGILDTGIWPESKSFTDEGMGPVPTRWRGTCQTNKRDRVKCNRKLIGARYFNKGYLRHARREARRYNTTYGAGSNFTTARDYDGHGTTTAAVAGGNFVANASFFGHGNGTAKGGSPKARVAAYKVCWYPDNSGGSNNLCNDADIMAGFEAAISDGVDVLSVSLGFEAGDYFRDAIAVGSFHAFKNGILVVLPSGNDGPTEPVENVAPWSFTVGASTINREFVSYVALGNKKILKGVSLSSAESLESQKFYPLISAVDAKRSNATPEEATACEHGALDERKINGKILVCVSHGKATVALDIAAAQEGVTGVIFANNRTFDNYLLAEPHLLPSSQISYKDAETLFAYINSTKSPVAQISDVRTEYNTKPAPTMSRFSSRGPNTIDPAFLKPDITAPGVNILASFSPFVSPSTDSFDKRRSPFFIAYGTSLSCPHVSGIVGLVKAVHPDWSPAAIKSAIMTTASTTDGDSRPILDYDGTKATPFAYGAGHLNPNPALDPGLVYDLNTENYLDYLCARGYNQTLIRTFTVTEKPYSCPKSFNILDFNYPSIVVPKSQNSIRVSRHLKNVGSPGTYNVSVEAPVGISIWVEPSSLKFEKYGEEKKFVLNVSHKANVSSKGYAFGKLVWSDGSHFVRSPIVINL